MQDLFLEKMALERIELIARLATINQCSIGDKELVINWIAELSSELMVGFPDFPKGIADIEKDRVK
jgi:hypothetical protein